MDVRAKMNQQRGRRFRSAKEAENNEKKARDRGEELPKVNVRVDRISGWIFGQVSGSRQDIEF